MTKAGYLFHSPLPTSAPPELAPLRRLLARALLLSIAKATGLSLLILVALEVMYLTIGPGSR